VIRTSNAYAFCDWKAGESTKSGNRSRTQNQEILDLVLVPAIDLNRPLERLLTQFAAVIAAKQGIEQGS
jgi:hypothetical protein